MFKDTQEHFRHAQSDFRSICTQHVTDFMPSIPEVRMHPVLTDQHFSRRTAFDTVLNHLVHYERFTPTKSVSRRLLCCSALLLSSHTSPPHSSGSKRTASPPKTSWHRAVCPSSSAPTTTPCCTSPRAPYAKP